MPCSCAEHAHGYPDGSEGQKFWVSQARNAFTAFTLYLFENFDTERKLQLPFAAQRFPTLGEVYRLSSGDGSDLRAYLRGLTSRPFLSKDAKTAFANLLSQADETFASIMGTFKEPLNAWINPVLDEATSRNDFLLTDVRKKKMTIYIGIQPNKLSFTRRPAAGVNPRIRRSTYGRHTTMPVARIASTL